VRTAQYVAKHFDSEICLLHVIPGTVDFCSTAKHLFDKMVHDHLHEIAEQIRAEGIRKVDAVVESGVPSDKIDRQATGRDVNVIIMGAGQSTDDAPFRLGTTTARIRRNATKPVWIVKRNSPPEINSILCPVDCSESSGQGLMNAIHLSRKFSAKLTLLTVVQGCPDYYQRFGEVPAEAREAFAQKHLSQFERFLGDYDFDRINWSKLVRYGEPYREILAVARETESDLLLMGSVGRTGLSLMLMGSVARKVAQEMPCSILTVKSEHVIRLQLDAAIADLKECLKQGQELLEQGFPEAALSQFQHCIARDMMCVPAWEGLAVAHRRLGHEEESKECSERATSIIRHLWDRQVEADIRSRHPLFGPNHHYL
jgi:nucleotide-binding universal stress UspA family protein